MRRREVLKRGTVVTAIAAMTGLPYLLSRLLVPAVGAAVHQRVPLPGAKIPAEAFTAACIGCGLCGEVCPPRCIEFSKHSGGKKANLPYINPEKTGCILCGLCMKVCPTDALAVTDVRQIDMGTAQIDRSACYPWVDQGVCGACVSICPLGESAIRFEQWNQYRPTVEKVALDAACVSRFVPSPVCPFGLFRESSVQSHDTV